MEETTNPEESQAQHAEEGAQPTETGTMKLGGGIELNGFSGIEKAQLVVVKKIVGNSAKEMSEKAKKFEKLSVSLANEGDSFNVHAELTDEGNQITADSSEKNLFLALSSALKGVIDKQATS